MPCLPFLTHWCPYPCRLLHQPWAYPTPRDSSFPSHAVVFPAWPVASALGASQSQAASASRNGSGFLVQTPKAGLERDSVTSACLAAAKNVSRDSRFCCALAFLQAPPGENSDL